jgi:oligopeptide/dipeptide ABC transporter ATP-binding protein
VTVTIGNDKMLEARHVVKHYPIKAGILFDHTVERVHAVDDVSFRLERGKTLGLVGESGCGKSTLCRTVLRLEEPTSGEILFEGKDITTLNRRALRPLRSQMQMIFQDPYASLNPRKRVVQIIGDPLRLHGLDSGDMRRTVQELLERVGLSPEHYNRFPHEFSGGQRQRIGIARALGVRPRLIVADEPVSALDVSIQAQIINLLKDLQAEMELTYVIVAHDLGVVRHVSNRIAVMYLGKVVEVSPAEDLYTTPHHPYTVALLSAIPLPDPKENAAREPLVLPGDVPSPIDPPPACRFHTRCPRATDICRRVEPPLVDYGKGHLAACHHPVNVGAADLGRVRIAPESPLSAGEDLPTRDPGLPDLDSRVAPAQKT